MGSSRNLPPPTNRKHSLRSSKDNSVTFPRVNIISARSCKVKYVNKEHARTRTFVCRARFNQILAQMLEACRKSAWNFRNDRKTPNYLRVLSSSVRDSCDNLFTSPSRNYSSFNREKDEVLVNLPTWTGFNSIDAIIRFLLHNNK